MVAQSRLLERRLIDEDGMKRNFVWDGDRTTSALRRLTSEDDAEGEDDPEYRAAPEVSDLLDKGTSDDALSEKKEYHVESVSIAIDALRASSILLLQVGDAETVSQLEPTQLVQSEATSQLNSQGNSFFAAESDIETLQVQKALQLPVSFMDSQDVEMLRECKFEIDDPDNRC